MREESTMTMPSPSPRALAAAVAVRARTVCEPIDVILLAAGMWLHPQDWPR